MYTSREGPYILPLRLAAKTIYWLFGIGLLLGPACNESTLDGRVQRSTFYLARFKQPTSKEKERDGKKPLIRGWIAPF